MTARNQHLRTMWISLESSKISTVWT